jgi:type I restriction enzyme S subunit
MKKYDKYKDSGIEWIGEIPEHWDVKKFDYLFVFSRGLGITKQDLLDEGVPCVNYGEIHSKYGFRVDPNKNQLKFVQDSYLETSNKSLLSRGDFVFADTSEDIEGSGNFTCLDSDTPTFAGYHTVIARCLSKAHYLFLAYYFDSLEYRNQIRNSVSGIKVYSITQAILKNTSVLFPPPEEQTAIANYLDSKTAEIDELIADKKRLLELYEEEKTAIINQAVTKGINPDVKMKDSGIEWMGEIPEHWEVKRLSWCFKIIGSGTTPKAGSDEYYFNGLFNWLLTGDLTDGEIHSTSKKITQKALDDHTSLKEYPVNSIVMAMYGATIGKLGILKIPTTVNQACCVMAEPIHLHYEFAFYVLLSARKEIINMSYGGGQPNISQELIKSFRVQIPPKDEQGVICNFINKRINVIEAQVQRTEKLIELLTEYRTALISEVVTGKIKVVD